jgi:D-sedoheptulose 7-phosphate isomerase
MEDNTKIPPPPLPPQVKEIADETLRRFPGLESAMAGLEKSYRTVVSTYEKGGIFYLCGNGGSFADAVHIKGELAKSFMKKRPLMDAEIISELNKTNEGKMLVDTLEMGFPAVVLGESHSLRSAFENDRDPVCSYAQELLSFVSHIPCGMFLGISTSGNAKNVAAAMTLAKAYKIPAISFTGPKGGRLSELADIDWRVPGAITAEIQENQLVLYHALCRMIEAYFFSGE